MILCDALGLIERGCTHVCRFSSCQYSSHSFLAGWNTKISARESNYGTRIDYILITRGLLPWVKGADIQPLVKGSDHCPVYLDLHDEIVDADGRVVRLQDVLGSKHGSISDKETPRLASKFWDEYSGKQMLLENFFGKTNTSSTITSLSLSPPPVHVNKHPESKVPVPEEAKAFHDFSNSGSILSIQITSPPPSTPTPPPPSTSTPQSTLSSTAKRKLTAETLNRSTSSKKQKQKKEPEKKAGQTKLSTFFNKPKNPSPSPNSPANNAQTADIPGNTEVDLEADYNLAVLLSSQESGSSKHSETDTADTADAKQAWSNILAPVQPPKCLMHGEPAKEFTVNKPGPNKGKKFFICAR